MIDSSHGTGRDADDRQGNGPAVETRRAFCQGGCYQMAQRNFVGAILGLSLALTGCSHNQGSSYADDVASRPMPTNDDERRQECDWVRSEIARQENLAQMGGAVATSPFMAMAMQAAARNNVAALESRAADVQCNAAFSNAPAPAAETPAPTSSSMNFDQCFARCQEVTSRTKEQCFDACK